MNFLIGEIIFFKYNSVKDYRNRDKARNGKFPTTYILTDI